MRGRCALVCRAERPDRGELSSRPFPSRPELIHSQGFQLSTPLSTGFSGLSSALLEQMRDEYPKSKFFSTGLISDARSWMREDSDVRSGTLFQIISD